MLQAGSSPVRVPDEVDFFNLPNPSSLTMALWVKSSRHIGLTTLPPSVSRISENVGASTSLKHKGLHGLYRDNFTFTLHKKGKVVPVLN
jgi:hypothetical protein